MFANVLHPDRYHGHGRKPPFFEGWYYKLVDAAGNARYAIIPGVFLNRDPAKEHAFIQVLNGLTGAAAYYRYPSTLFWAADDIFDVRIGPNRFTGEAITLDLEGEAIRLRGTIHFDSLTPWPVTLISPGIMGWYAWVPVMETYHGVLSLDHSLSGWLEVDGQQVDFGGGRGYIEKDWGAAFPDSYVWLQTNHFSQIGTSLTASIATIPWLTGHFGGFIVGLWHQGVLYRFATYTGAKTERLEITDKNVRWVVRDRYRRLRMEATRAQGGLIYGPDRASMGLRIGETMQATVDVQLFDWRGQERLLFSGQGHHAGLEVHGAIERLLQLA